MAGHSKWANIRHKKSRQDAKRGKVFSRIAKEIISAVKVGGPDPKANPRLRLIIQKAREVNVPNEIIERNIKKGSSQDQSDYVEMLYELYGHGGVGILVEAMTDNKNRLASEMRIATNKRGGTIASPGAVAFNFEKRGVIQVPKDSVDEEKLFLEATEAGALDFETADEFFMITTDPQELDQVKKKLIDREYAIEESQIEWVPNTFIPCDKEFAESNLALIEWLENIDDVDSVYHNMEPTD